MAIAQSDIQLRLSGGGSNGDPTAALGGAKSSSSISSTILHNIFDRVSGDESAAGDVEYRILYIHNNHSSLAAQNVKVWLHSNPLNDIDLGFKEAVNATAGSIADEDTAPSGVSWSTAPTSSSKVDVATSIPAGQHRALYLRRTIAAGTAADDDAEFEVRVQIDTSE